MASGKSKQTQKREILGLLIISFAILLFLGLVSYHASDYPNSGNARAVKNWLGLAGAYLSYWFYVYTIGYASIVFSIVIFLFGCYLFLNTSFRSFLKLSFYLLTFAFLISVTLAMPQAISEQGSPLGYRLSGLFGGFIAEKLIRYFGTAGTIVILFTTFLILLSTLLSWSVKDTLLRIKEGFQTFWEGFQSKGQEEKDIPPIQSEATPPEGKPMAFPQSPIPVRRPEVKEPPKAGPVPKSTSMGVVSRGEYRFPPLDLLSPPVPEETRVDKSALMRKARFLEEKLKEFEIFGQVVGIMPGPIITRFEVRPAPGVKVSRFLSVQEDLALVMQAERIRIVPIPGKAVVGVEIPNESPIPVMLREIIEAKAFQSSPSKLTIALGKTIEGLPYVTDLAQLPHLLVAGATGSGKSMCLNTIITSILYRARPSEVKFVLIDPKKLELSLYGPLHHHHLAGVQGLEETVVTTVDNAVAVLRSLEIEMDKRYRILASAGVRNIEDYNRAVHQGKVHPQGDEKPAPLPYIVLIIDELADLMVLGAREIEEPIARLAQMARAVGMHLILATQRPSVDVITGVIKANFPARIAFQVASKTDSRTILDRNGAEKLLGKGDMLFLHPREPEPIRLHGAYISTEEVQRVVNYIRQQPQEDVWKLPGWGSKSPSGEGGTFGERDELFREAARLVVRHQQGSASLLQRRLRIGYARAGRLIDELEAAGILGPFDGSKAREVLVDEETLERILNEQAFSSEPLEEEET